jgi:hypothetical protein
MAFGGRADKERVLCELAVFGQPWCEAAIVRRDARDGDQQVTILPRWAALVFRCSPWWARCPPSGQGLRPTSKCCSTEPPDWSVGDVRGADLRFHQRAGWERLLWLTERHEVVAVRLVDPREYELPDAGLLYVQDAESGEQLLVDSSDPESVPPAVSGGREQDLIIRRSVAGARVVTARGVDRGRSPERLRAWSGGTPAPTMSFRSPRSPPAVVAAYVASMTAADRRGAALPGRGSPPRLVVDGPGGAGTCRCAVRRRFTPVVARPPVATVKTPAPSDGRSRYRRLQQHGCRRCRRRASRPKTAALAFVRQQPSGVRIGGWLGRAAVTSSRRPWARRRDHRHDRLPWAVARHWDRDFSPSDAIAGKTLTINEAALGSDAGHANIGYYGGAIIVLSPMVKRRASQRTMARLCRSPRPCQTVGSGTAAGTTADAGFGVANALDSGVLKQVATATNGSYYLPRRG